MQYKDIGREPKPMISFTKLVVAIVIIIGVVMAVTSESIADIDAPHNESNNVSCGSCHGQGLLNSPFWGGSGSYDQICLNCHTASSGPYTETNAPLVKTHSSQNTSDQYGEWSRECRNCHDPHYQKQKIYRNTDAGNLYLATGTITLYVYNGDGTSTLTYSSITYKSGWGASKLLDKTEKGGNDKRSTVLFPNVKKLGYSYPIIAVDTPTANTITVKGNVTPVYQYISSSTFAALYGQYIKEVIDVSGFLKAVKFFDKEGTNLFADGDGTYDGICEVCHTQTEHFRNVSGAPDQNHSNLGSDVPGANCMTCHLHIEGFKNFTNTLYFKPGAQELPAEPMPNAHQTLDTFQGGTWIGRSMSPWHSTTAYETKSQTTNSGANPGYWRMVTFTSPPVVSAVSIPAGDWIINIYCRVSNIFQNAYVRYKIYKWNSDDSIGATIVAVGTYGTEMGITAAPGGLQTITVSGGAVTLAAGDKISVDIELQTRNPGNNNYEASYYYGQNADSKLVMPVFVSF